MNMWKRLFIISGALVLLPWAAACSAKTSKEPLASSGESALSQESTQEAASHTTETGDAITVSKAGYDSPEDAIKAYLTGLRDSDLSLMFHTFGVEHYTVYLSLQKAGEEGSSPAQDVSPTADFIKYMAIEETKGGLLDDIVRQYTVLGGINQELLEPVSFYEDGEGMRFLAKMSEQLNNTDLSSLKLLGFISPESFSDTFYSDMITTAKHNKVDKYDSRMAVVELNNHKYALLFDIAEYGGSWFIQRPGGILANMAGMAPDSAGAELIAPEDEKYLKELLIPAELKAAQSSGQEPARIEESAGFDSPEKAAKAYLEGLKANDANHMLGTFALETYVDHFDFYAYLDDIRGYVFLRQEFDLPVINSFTRSVNILSRKKKILKSIGEQFAALCLINGDYFCNYPIRNEEPENEEIVENIIGMSNGMDWDSMKILGAIPPGVLFEKYSLFDEHMKQRAKIYGADKIESIAIAFELGGNNYYLCLDAIEYNGRWYNLELGGTMSAALLLPASSRGIMTIEPGQADEKRLLDSILPVN